MKNRMTNNKIIFKSLRKILKVKMKKKKSIIIKKLRKARKKNT